jgi:hypothetical protein
MSRDTIDPMEPMFNRTSEPDQTEILITTIVPLVGLPTHRLVPAVTAGNPMVSDVLHLLLVWFNADTNPLATHCA